MWEGFHVGTMMDIDPHHLCFARITHTHTKTHTLSPISFFNTLHNRNQTTRASSHSRSIALWRNRLKSLKSHGGSLNVKGAALVMKAPFADPRPSALVTAWSWQGWVWGESAGSSWCWLWGSSSGAAASPSPSEPQPAPSWLSTAPVSNIRFPPPASVKQQRRGATGRRQCGAFYFVLLWWNETIKSCWATTKKKGCGYFFLVEPHLLRSRIKHEVLIEAFVKPLRGAFRVNN